MSRAAALLIAVVLLLSGCAPQEPPKSGNSDAAESSYAEPSESEPPPKSIDPANTATAAPESHPEHDGVSVEHTVQIHESLPDFVVRATGPSEGLTDVAVVNPLTGLELYRASLLDSTWYEDGIPPDLYELEVTDVDFDGFGDLCIFLGHNGNWNKSFAYILWDPDGQSFYPDSYGLSGLGLPGFDSETQRVYSMARASVADHWYYTHRYAGEELLLIEVLSREWIRPTGDLHAQLAQLMPLYDEQKVLIHRMRKVLEEETGQWAVPEESFQLHLFTSSEWTLLAEYDIASDTGVALKELLDENHML